MTLRSLRIFIGLRIMDARDSKRMMESIAINVSGVANAVQAGYQAGLRDGQQKMLDEINASKRAAAAREAEHDKHVKRW